jgi:hypothetical protein
MSSIPYTEIKDPELYERLAMSMAETVGMILQDGHAVNARLFNTTDAGPMLSGAIAGIVQFIFDTDGDWPSARAGLIKQMDNLAPQMEMNRTAQKRAANDAGQA